MDALRRLTPVVDEEGPRLALGQTAELAARHRLSVYDANYLELAIRRRLPPFGPLDLSPVLAYLLLLVVRGLLLGML